jgi:twinkle protein
MENELAYGKDASDYLTGGFIKEWRQLIKDAFTYEPEGVVNGMDIDLDDLLEKLPEGAVIPFEGLQEKLHGIRKAEITTVCAGSGIGKSTLVREITKSLIEQGLSVANVALEDQMNVAAQALVALDMDIPLSTFRFNPPPKAKVQPHYDKMIANGNTYFYKHFAGITADSLMNRLYYYARSKSVDYIVLDHLSLVISSSNSQNERKDIDTLMTNLAKMVVETGVGLIQIVHLKRTGGDKSFAKGGEVELTDLRGSAALEQLSWSVIGLERDQQGDDRDFSRARVLKNRTFGFTGLADELKFEPSTGRMRSVLHEMKTEPPEGEDDEDVFADTTTETEVDSGHRDND